MTIRCYCPQIQLNQNALTITDLKEIHHIKNVLRLKKGEPLTVFDGEGQEYHGVIDSFGPQTAVVRVNDVRRNERVRPLLILACAVPKKGKFEDIIEKATELGADEIIPLQTRRTEVVFKPEARERKQQRFESVAVSAAKQCQRSTIPVIHPPMNFKDALAYLKIKTFLVIPSLSGDRQPLLKVLEEFDWSKGISFLIGPEGDFTLEEYQWAWKEGACAVTLGETVLRVETAAVSVIAAANFYLDRIMGTRPHSSHTVKSAQKD